jgi:hypothetical protein
LSRLWEKPSLEGLPGDRGDGWTGWSLSDARQIISMTKDNLATGLPTRKGFAPLATAKLENE